MACALAKLLALRQLPGEIEGEGFWLVEVGPCCHGDGNGFGSVRRAIRRALRVWRKQLLIWSLTPCETDIWINCAQTCLRNSPRRGTPCMIVSMWMSVRLWVGDNKKIELWFFNLCPPAYRGWVSNRLKVNAVKWLCLEQASMAAQATACGTANQC